MTRDSLLGALVSGILLNLLLIGVHALLGVNFITAVWLVLVGVASLLAWRFARWTPPSEEEGA